MFRVKTHLSTLSRKLCLILMLFGMLGFTSCSTVKPTNTPVIQSTRSVMPTKAIPGTVTSTFLPVTASATASIPTKIPTPFLTSTPNMIPPLSGYNVLPPGQYVAYTDPNVSLDSLYAISLDGKHKQILMKQFSDLIYLATLPTNGKIWVRKDDGDRQYILDFRLNALTEFTIPGDYCQFDFSPDLTMVVSSACAEYAIYVNGLQKDMHIRLTPSGDDYYGFPVWSPDNKWIAFFNLAIPFKANSRDGLYLVDISCLSKPEICSTEMQGPYRGNPLMYMDGPHVWSPDSRYLAMFSDGLHPPIQIFDVQTQEFSYLDAGNVTNLEDLIWSPDGKWLVYSGQQENKADVDIFIIPVSGGPSVPLVVGDGDQRIYLGLQVPAYKFKIGNTYAITERGVMLNLRESPSSSAQVITELFRGNIVMLLDGPVQADGHIWWKMRTEDGIEGWAIANLDWYEPVDS